MIRAPLADLLTGSRLILGVMAADALIADRLLLFSIVLAGAWVTTKLGVPFTTVAVRLKPETLYDRFVAYPDREPTA